MSYVVFFSKNKKKVLTMTYSYSYGASRSKASKMLFANQFGEGQSQPAKQSAEYYNLKIKYFL
jgi:hypothetical protein